MSCYSVMNAMLRKDLTPHESRVYAYLVFRANGKRICWPSVKGMMADLDAGRRTIMSATAKLRELGLIRVKRRHHDMNVYYVTEQPGENEKPVFTSGGPAVNDTWDGPDDFREGAETGTDGASIGAETTTANVQEPPPPEVPRRAPESVQQESNKKPTRQDTPLPPTLSGIDWDAPEQAPGTDLVPAAPPPPAFAPSDVFAAWNTVAAERGLAPAKVINERRLRQLSCRIRETGIDTVMRAIAAVRDSSFCCGDNDRGWRADIDFLLQPKSFVRLIEGFYSDKARKILRPKFSQPANIIAEAMGMNTPEAFQEFRAGLTRDNSAFMKGALDDGR
jgi:Helix-turn-helix domain